MGSRLQLHTLLCSILGSSHVYFQPPPTVSMNYPAIVYTRYTISSEFADNIIYKKMTAYTITVISKDPDNDIFSKVSELPMCKYDRGFTSDNLNHDVFILYY